jgi:cytidine deaminase
MEDPLLHAAFSARGRAYAPFSGFRVGAAIEDEEGRLFTGCNIENASYGLTLCAERVALFKAVSEGFRSFKRIAIVADTNTLTPPCGACRQVLWEFCGNVQITLANLDGRREDLKLADLYPRPFDVSSL